MSARFVRLFQSLAAGAVVFAILGGCGFAPPPRRRGPVVPRPRPPRPELTIRSLTGEWQARLESADSSETLRLTLRQTGDALTGRLTIRGRTWSSEGAPPARLDVAGDFVLQFGPWPGYVVRGRPGSSGDSIAASVAGAGLEPAACVFRRPER